MPVGSLLKVETFYSRQNLLRYEAKKFKFKTTLIERHRNTQK